MSGNTVEPVCDGIHAMVPREQMLPEALLLRDTYAVTPGVRLIRQEFGYYCLDEWREQGMPEDVNRAEYFHYDKGGASGFGGLGWCEASFSPGFESKVIEDRGDHEVIQDGAGRHLLVFKGRRNGFMPEYIDHPVKDRKTWEDQCKWRMDPETPARWEKLDDQVKRVTDAAGQGKVVCQSLAGGYMYLRSLIGPADLLYAFYDMPDVVHDCMKTWFRLADAVIARHQQHVTLDMIYFAEDICYNHGSLISPEMMDEFLAPYYQQLLTNLKARQIDKSRRLHVKVDTDGWAGPVIPWYQKTIGMNIMTPFEVASGCDVVELGKQYPDLVMYGGIDKRVLAAGKDAIDKHVEYILPAMRARGGYIPHCDHGVPAEVKLEDYHHYRKRCIELGG